MTQRAPRAPVALFLTVLTLIGCSATGPAPARFEERQALPAPIEPRQIALTRLVSKLPVGTRIGRTSEGWLCLPQGLMTWLLAQEAFVKAVGSTGRAQLR